MMKPFPAGHAAELGVFSAELTDLGWMSADSILKRLEAFFIPLGAPRIPARSWTNWENPGRLHRPAFLSSHFHPAHLLIRL